MGRQQDGAMLALGVVAALAFVSDRMRQGSRSRLDLDALLAQIEGRAAPEPARAERPLSATYRTVLQSLVDGRSGQVSASMRKKMLVAGHVQEHGLGLRITDAGRQVIGAVDPVETGLPEGFEGFGFSSRPVEYTPRMRVRQRIEKQLGQPPQLFSASQYLKQPGLASLLEPRIYLYDRWPDRAWQIAVATTDRDYATRIGRRAMRNLIARRSLPASVFAVHEWPLYVVYDTDYVRLDPVIKAKSAGPSELQRRKNKLVNRAREYFGRRGASISGSESKGYQLHLRPALKKFRGVFGDGSHGPASLDDLETKLDETIAKIDAWMAQNR